jgi:hypothetical protein
MPMDFEWDEAKRHWVLRERGLDFLDAALLFDGRNLLSVLSPRGDEERWLSIGELDGRMIAVDVAGRGDPDRHDAEGAE